MEEERYSRIPNPNTNPNSQNKLTAPSILDRFQSMVRDRDEELRNPNPSQSLPPPPLDSAEVVYFYQQLLRDLTFNSKPIISELTMIAGDYKQFAEGIAGAICSRVFEVAPDQKLPALYLLDSIVKNIGEDYIHHFIARLPEVFIGAYNRVHPSQHQAMRHLFRTWSQVFPSHVLRRIEDALQFGAPTAPSSSVQQRLTVGPPVRQSESPGPSPRPSIHVNPKYLEAQHQFKSSSVYRGDYDRRTELLPLRVGPATHQTPLNPDIPLTLPPQRKPTIIPPSPTRIGIRRSRSPPPDPYIERPNGLNGYRTHNTNPRELIDAYGGDNREKIAKIPRLDVGARDWERSEEREYVWESMSPTLSDRNRRDPREVMGLYGSGSVLVSNRVGLERPAEPDLRRGWPGYERNYGLDERRPVAENSTYHKYQNNMASRPEPVLPYHQSVNHVHESSKHLPYTGSTMVQPSIGPPHHVRPVSQPPLVSRVRPPHKIPEKETKPFYVPPPKPEYSTNTNNYNPRVAAPNWTPPVSGAPVPVHMPQLVQPRPQLHVPPLPPGPPPTGGVQAGPVPVLTGGVQSSGSGSSAPNAFAGLLSNLMAQGLISLAPPQPSESQDSVGFEFNPELLKVRHESAINSLYSDLPRQCTTCGLRFRQQEEHRAHMDWHVTKNRVARNRKQKPSRKWFVSAKEWLRGAETLGTEVVPGFLPTEPVVEREKEEKEIAVPADENQTVCALCGESFEDFYSDETEEWMYKGAVYMAGTDGSSTGTGPIVHAKCLGTNFDG